MEQLKAFQRTVISSVLMVILVSSVEGQISTPCTASMMSNFTPCANFITGSTNNGTTASSTCCEALRSLMSTSADCACLVISANVPFQLPFSTALALSLTKACNMNGLPAQCKASGSPLPAPGPAALGGNGATLPPIAASPLSPQSSEDMAEAKVAKMVNRRLAQAEAEAPAPASAPEQAEARTRTPGIRPVLTPRPSASNPSYVSFSPSVLVFISIMLVSTTF